MTDKDKTRLRELAGRYAELAKSEHMEQRREKWRLHNGLHEKTFPFHIEDNGSYFRDLTPPCECEDRQARGLEGRLLRALTMHDRIDDDRIIPDRFLIHWHMGTTQICDELETTRADNGRGSSLGYQTNQPIKDIEADFHKLKKRVPTLNRESTEQAAAFAREVFDGLLPVDIGQPGTMYSGGITNTVVHLMGMEEMYMQMALDPEGMHKLFSFLADDRDALGKWEEDENLLTLNHDGNQGYCSGSSLYSDETAEVAGDQVMNTDRWGYLESQESVSVSAGMFDELLMPYFSRAADQFKLLKWGCCEPVHDLMPVLSKLNGMRKVSVTPWCDQKKLTETCPENVIWCRKPVPLKLCGEKFDIDDLRAHLQETLEIGKDYFVEFVFRDTCLLSGEMEDRVAQTCAMIRKLMGHQEGSSC